MPITDRSADDQRIFNLIRQGGKMRERGISELYRKYASLYCRRIQYKFRLNATDAEDIVQEVFMNVDRKCESYKGDAPFEAWLWSIARNCARDHFRSAKARRTENLDGEGWELLEQESEDMKTYDPSPDQKSLEDCVKRGYIEFAEKFSERALVLSMKVQGFVDADIAAAIQRNPGATREYILQCKKKIEEFLLPCRKYLSAA